jgi:hypothetical protein
MPEWPHEYIVRARVDEELFERLVVYIRAHGREGRFYEKAITYYEDAGTLYWTMGRRSARRPSSTGAGRKTPTKSVRGAAHFRPPARAVSVHAPAGSSRCEGKSCKSR